jgi:hypothetical protein
MFSIIIPTIWKNNRIIKLLEELNTNKSVGEIIIINNNKENTPNIGLNSDKLKIITPDKNIYVNPSWNLGVKKAKYDNIALCNDDITFNTKIFSYLKPKDDSLIGLDDSCYKLIEDQKYQLIINKKLNYGFGCLLIFNKNSYKPIPEFLKIWYGDNYLHKNTKNVYSLIGLKIETEMSSSKTIPEYYYLVEQDKINFTKMS